MSKLREKRNPGKKELASRILRFMQADQESPLFVFTLAQTFNVREVDIISALDVLIRQELVCDKELPPEDKFRPARKKGIYTLTKAGKAAVPSN